MSVLGRGPSGASESGWKRKEAADQNSGVNPAARRRAIKGI